MNARRWPPWEVESSRQVLQQLSDHISRGMSPTAPEVRLSPETLGWLSRLLVVRSCGHLEQVVKECSRAHIENRSGGPVQTFALSWMDRSRNPSRENLVGLLARFNVQWSSELETMLDADDQKLHRDLAWAVDTRNRIAHGENQGASAEKALTTRESLEEIAQWWVLRTNPF